MPNSRRARHEHGQGGFTLVELLIGFIIIFGVPAMAIPAYLSITRNLRSNGDARDINGEVALAKMRAAADFTQARFYADLAAQTFRIEVWNKPVPPATTGSWSSEGGTQSLSQGVTWGYGALSSPPLNTQSTIGQAPACLNVAATSIANTACIVFNSRGIPVDANGTPNADGAIYATDGSSVYAVTVSATGLIRTWRTDAKTTNWQKR